jgi:VWFA-related protein
VQLVRIDVTVLDGKRQPVRGLQASDFTVLEDGQPRPIRAFTAVDHAAAAAEAPPAATMAPLPVHDVATNRAGDDTSRLIVILMDRSIPPDRPMFIARQIADAAVDALAPGDLAAIVTTGGGVPQNFTSDRARLHKTIADSDWSQALSQAQMDDPILAMLGMNDPLGDGRCMCGLCVLDTITRIANDVRGVPRRKILLFVGSNIIVQVGTPTFNPGLSCDKLVRDSREKLFDALGTSGLTVHSIDPQGMASVGPATRASVPNGIENRDGRTLNGQLTQERMDFMKAQGNLEVLPALTGGRTILNSNEPFRMVPDVLHESDVYYLLAFEPAEGERDARHTVEVKVARKGVDVHSARFIAPSGATAEPAAAAPLSPLDRALTNLLPDASLPLGMTVAAFAGPDRDHAYVGVTLDASAFAAARGSIPLEIALSASDERGRRVGGARQNGTIDLPPAAVGTAPPFVELQTFLALPPGTYELRGAVMHAGTGAASSVFTHITVPAFDEGRLAMSDLVLGSRENAGILPADAPSIPIVPTTARVFRAGEPAWAFLRVYRNAETRVAPVSLDTSVLDAHGKRVKQHSLRDLSFVGRNADVRLALPVRDLAPGRYVLRIDAKQGSDEASRSVSFAVEASQAVITQTEHSPELDAVLAAAAEYIDRYEQRISAIGAEEDYQQAVQTQGGGMTTADLLSRRPTNTGTTTSTRKTRANIMTLSLGARGWVSFRDVFELDGTSVRDREERLSRILQNVNPDSIEQARGIAAESARYNLDSEALKIDRTINVPMTALIFLRGANQSHSSFRLGKPERVAGIACVTLLFTEQSLPRLIRTGGDAPPQGTFWIDMAGGGRIVKTELRIASAGVAWQSVRSQIAVTYARVDKLDLWVPVVMDEIYDLPATRQQVTGRATYSGFREFKVTTSEGIK